MEEIKKAKTEKDTWKYINKKRKRKSSLGHLPQYCYNAQQISSFNVYQFKTIYLGGNFVHF